MNIQELIQLTINRLNKTNNDMTIAYQEGRMEDYYRLKDEASEIEKILEKLNS